MRCYRILVVDDSKLVHDLARMAFETVAGWDVIAADSGAEALERAKFERPDALLLDVEMPEMDGPATLAALRAGGEQVPIVFLTGHDDPDDRARLAALDVDGIISKPFDVDQLADQLAGVLGWSR